MVKLNTIYTRTGDEGTTGLVGTDRVAKHSPRIEAIGAVDEANSTLGMARLTASAAADAALARVQNDLFDLGADLATLFEEKPQYAPLRIIAAQVERLEKEIDGWNENLPALHSFILPGGSATSAALHVSRTIVRRAERAVFRLAEGEWVNKEALKYLNRLSDHLFVLARVENNNGAGDVLWVPGKER